MIQPLVRHIQCLYITRTPGKNQLILSLVEPIFEALSLCASLHPDPADEDDMDDDNDVFIDTDPSTFEVFTGDEGQELSEAGRVRSSFVNDNRFNPY
jgi:chloride channel, nucleotide-sensitive, 1A